MFSLKHTIKDLDLTDTNKVFNDVFNFLLSCILYHMRLNSDFAKYCNKMNQNLATMKWFLYNDIYGGNNVIKVYTPMYNDKPIGVCSLCRTNDDVNTIYLNTLYILVDYRCKGYGQHIIKRIKDDFPDKNIELDVFKDNVKAIQSYKSFGFKVIKEYKYDIDKAYNIEAIRMRLEGGRC